MFLWVAKKLSVEGHEVTICTFGPSKNVTVPTYLKCIDFSAENLGIFGRIKRIRQIIKQGSYDLSISFLLDANVYNIFACRGLKTKSVVCERNDPFKPHYWKLKFWRPWFRFADGAVFQLPKVAEYYKNIKGKTAIIPNPVKKVKCEVKKTFVNRDDVIVSVGRIDLFQKRQDVLVKAFALFHQKYPSFNLIIYGDGNETDTLKLNTLIKELQVEKSVILAGAVDNSIEKILKAKIFVLSSDFEGIPNALIEAMAVGLPCISTDCRPGGARLLIEDGKNGVLVQAGDYWGLADKMEYLVENPNLADDIAERAKVISEKFSESKILKLWVGFLQGLVAN